MRYHVVAQIHHKGETFGVTVCRNPAFSFTQGPESIICPPPTSTYSLDNFSQTLTVTVAFASSQARTMNRRSDYVFLFFEPPGLPGIHCRVDLAQRRANCRGALVPGVVAS